VPYSDLPKIDKYALFQLETVVASMKDSYENYQFFKVYQVCLHFACLCQFHIFDLFSSPFSFLYLNPTVCECMCIRVRAVCVWDTVSFGLLYMDHLSVKQKVHGP
jgi:hypothetical protein